MADRIKNAAEWQAAFCKIMRLAYWTIHPRQQWTQHSFQNATRDGVAYCALGAVRQAVAVVTPDLGIDADQIADLLDRRVAAMRMVDEDGEMFTTIVDVNDQDDADKAHRDVLTVFRATIKQYRPKPRKRPVTAPPLQPVELHEVRQKQEEVA